MTGSYVTVWRPGTFDGGALCAALRVSEGTLPISSLGYKTLVIRFNIRFLLKSCPRSAGASRAQ
jgi:hypothetical protein